MDAFVRGVQGGLSMSEQRLIDKNEQEQIYVNSFSDEEMDDFASALNLVIETFCKFSDKHNFDRDNIIAFVAEKLQQFSEIATVKNYEVREQPAIDPVRHGKWVIAKDKDGFAMWDACSSCGHGLHYVCEGKRFPYCPNCGDRMDKE